MNAIFEEMKEPELFSPRNGKIIFHQIEGQFDSGKLVLEKRTVAEVLKWLAGKTRDYHSSPLTWRQLNDRPLHFLNDFRPRTRSSGEAAAISLTDEINHVYWGTAGRYVPKRYAQGFYRRIGGLVSRASRGSILLFRDANILLHAAASQVETKTS
ncbi:hypothetical protein V8E54_006127 [Elaphomyces granulatus]